MTKNTSIKKLIKNLGLNNKEASVFISIYKLGNPSVKDIARDTEITRTHIYDINSSLLEKGLISESEKRGVKHYESLDHAGLIAHISIQQKKWKKVEKDFEQAASLFKNLKQNTSQKTKVRFYEGIKGITTVFEQARQDLSKLPESKRRLITVWPTEKLEKTYPGFYEKEIYFNMKGLKKRDIMYESEMTETYIKKYSKGPTKHDYRIWPNEKGEFPTDALCWGNKVAYTDVEGYPSSIVIESKAVSDTFRMYFEEMWLSLKKS